jgi:hypothetical protein
MGQGVGAGAESNSNRLARALTAAQQVRVLILYYTESRQDQNFFPREHYLL